MTIPKLETPPISSALPSTKRRIWVVVPFVFLLIFISGLVWWLEAQHYETTDDAFIDTQMVRIAPSIAGRVLHVVVKDNQDVQAGDLLAEVDPADFQVKLDQALAQEYVSKSALAQAQAQQTAAEANVLEAEAVIKATEAYASNTSTKDIRNQRLAEKLVISRQQLEDSAANTKVDYAMLDAARKKRDSSQAQVIVAESQVASAEASIRSAEADVEQARLNLSKTKIVAPQDGRVTQKNVTDGNYLEIGQQFMLIIPHDIWVTANFKENQLEHIHPGQPVDIRIDAYPNHIFQGHVDSLESGSGAAFSLLPPENATGNYIKIVQRVPVKIVFDEKIDSQYHLGPGMSVVPTVNIQ